MAHDSLSLLLTRFRLSARLFFSGALCNTVDFPEDTGFVHVIKREKRACREERRKHALAIGAVKSLAEDLGLQGQSLKVLSGELEKFDFLLRNRALASSAIKKEAEDS